MAKLPYFRAIPWWMKGRLLLLLSLTVMSDSCQDNQRVNASYDEYPVYNGNDLGLLYTKENSRFKVWSPTARAVSLHLYKTGDGDDRIESVSLSEGSQGTWEATVNRDLKGQFYTFQVQTEKERLGETPGIYAKAVGVNGARAAVVDLLETNPEEWDQDKRPPLKAVNDAIIYEMHVRDFTIHPTSGSKYPGKYIGLTERGTKSPAGLATGIDHLVELGITHVHLLPVFDFRSVNEATLDSPQYNWGYDPQNYNAPEGSFSTNPYDPVVRIRELKQLVKAIHDAGIRVIMDVVYNHTGLTEGSNFNLETPGYYYRHMADGKYSDAAACGNETASERPMMRKFIIESCAFWVKEYHIDGFRFDLMGIHDIETMNAVSDRLLEIEPSLILYGEGWTAKGSPLPDSLRALKANVAGLKSFAAFSDELRDGLKGSVFDENDKGFVNGGVGAEQSIRFGIVAATNHPQVDYTKVNYSKKPWAREPWQCINYVSCHDNHTLADKLKISGYGKFTKAQLTEMDKLANGIVLTSQGISFLHAGEEMMRTKKGVENSFNRPDTINAIDWTWKSEYADVFEHYKMLISLRKTHPAFRLPTAKSIQDNLRFLKTEPGVIAYTIQGAAAGDSWKQLLVAINSNDAPSRVVLPEGMWKEEYETRSKEGSPRIVKNGERLNPKSLMIFSSN